MIVIITHLEVKMKIRLSKMKKNPEGTLLVDLVPLGFKNDFN